jgi:hypothetical protein
LEEWQFNQDALARRLELTPADGWQGKNAEQRDTARDQAFAADEQLQLIIANAEDAHVRAALTDGEIQALEAKRRSLEWAIRAQLIEALSRNGVQANHNPGQNSTGTNDTAFDDVADHQVDTAAFAPELELNFPADDFPF